MPCSDKKRRSNAINSRNSTGPKSPSGKKKVSLNGLKHGFRSPLVVLPGEDHAAFDAMMAHWMDDWQPPTHARRVLVEQAVAHAWRLSRCLKLERDHLIRRGIEAAAAAARAAESRAQATLNSLYRDRSAALTALLADRHGLAALIGAWADLADAASPEDWSDHEESRLLDLLDLDESIDVEEVGGPVLASRRLVERSKRMSYDPDDTEPTAQAAELSVFIADELAKLRAYGATHFAGPDPSAVPVAVPDDSPEGRALLRYEGQHGREFRATLNQLIKLTQTGLDLVEPDESAAKFATQIIMDDDVESDQPPASSEVAAAVIAAPSQAAEAVPAAPSQATEAAPPAPSKANEAPESAPEGPPAPSKANEPPSEGSPAPSKATGGVVVKGTEFEEPLDQWRERAGFPRSDR